MSKAVLISAVGTPLTTAETLHVDGLKAHLDDQWSNGISGVLVAGTMGLMQLLTDETYRDLARHSVDFCAGRGELLIGAGDCSFARTKARISYLNTLRIDGVVVLTPYFIRFSQPELIDYFGALADIAKAPLYLYDLPQRTGSKIEFATVLELSKHPNIRGIKCSDEPGYAREVRDAVGPDFRVVIAQPVLLDAFLRFGFMEHVDGMFAIAPQWASAVARDVAAENWGKAAECQQLLNSLRTLVGTYGPFGVMNTLLNERGIEGNFAPAPYRLITEAQRAMLMAEPTVQHLLHSRDR